MTRKLTEQVEVLMKQMAEKQGVNEQLKEAGSDEVGWVDE